MKRRKGSAAGTTLRSPSDERRRLMMFGPDQLADVGLLALVLRGDKPAERAHLLLHDAGGLLGLDRALPQRLARIPGVGPAAAAAVVAALELGRRMATLAVPYAQTIEGPEDVAGFLRASIGAAPQESFLVLGLDVRRRLQLVRTVAMGSLCAVNVHPREVFRPLVHAGVHGVILVHNHPSGEAEPSDADVLLTHRIAEVGHVIGIAVLDHLVVTRSAVVSMADRGHV